MTLLGNNAWELAAWLAVAIAVTALAFWLVLRKRPTAEELERIRRQFLVQSGRLVDGMLLDLYEVPAEEDKSLTMLLFNNQISGVDYECSQDVTTICNLFNPQEIRIGFPCNVRYQPGNPQNSIVVAEGWSGLRERLPQLPSYDDPNPIDTSHRRPRHR